LKALVAGFVTIDTIQLPVRSITSVGGPPSYAGLICARFGLDVTPLTMVGGDFPEDQAVWLSRNGVSLKPGDRSAKKGTTRFRIEANSDTRRLVMLARCEDISKDHVPDSQFNGSLVSPIAQEISSGVLSEIAKRSDFTMLDPQGFVRSFDGKGEVTISKLKDEKVLGKVDAIKMDKVEAEAVTGKAEPKAALSKLASSGIRKAIVTRAGQNCFVLDGNKVFEIPVPQVQVVDSTGAGDILAGSAMSTYMKSRDFLWSACFGIAASSLSLHMIALSKVDLPISVDEQARRLYSLASPAALV
jgi:sugar/nucleoside kinase (ribokinase family)